MTHEYVIALGGRVEPAPADGPAASAIGWAAAAVLAIGSDAEVRAISRGDSSFVDLRGCSVTALPSDLDAAVAVVAGLETGRSVGAALAAADLLGAGPELEVGSPADLAFWSGRELVATVQAGAFTQGDEHFGPFPRAT
jgi:hypothetical protein